MKNKKIIVFILLAIILIVLGIIFVPKFFTKDQPATASSTPKTFNTGDLISVEDLETLFKDIYDKHALLGISLLSSDKNAEYPYITNAMYFEDRIEIYFSTDTVSISAKYNKSTSDIKSVYVILTNPSNEEVSNMITSLSTSECFIKNAYGNIDMSISNGIRGSLNDSTESYKDVLNKYKDVVLTTKKTTSLDDGIKTVSFYILKN